MRIITRFALGITLIAGLAACAPPPEPVAQVTCSAMSGSLQVSPGLKYQTISQTYSVDNSTQLTGCTDDLGLGITGATVQSASLVFPLAGCAEVSDAAGSGRLHWSDGSISAFTMTASPLSFSTVRLQIHVTTGQFAGSRGSIDVDVAATAGDCESGITAETLLGGPLTLKARPAAS